MEEIAGHPDVDIVVIATSGKAGLSATLAAVRAGKKVAIANKEPLVMAGEIITGEAKKSGAQLLPIDSEHSAIWQCLNGESQPPKRILLTASGGPFRGFSTEQLNQVTSQQALQHPSWQMGQKVTIDSATLMNKGLEIMEARWLFNMPLEQIDVIIHPRASFIRWWSLSTGPSKPSCLSPICGCLSIRTDLAGTGSQSGITQT